MEVESGGICIRSEFHKALAENCVRFLHPALLTQEVGSVKSGQVVALEGLSKGQRLLVQAS